MLNHYLKMILNARVYEVARETPLEPARRLSQRLGNQIWMKREDLQPVFSFKIRGAYNKIAHLTDEEAARGVIAASAGNHAQGVALGARQRGIKALIVMPRTTPQIKVAAVRSYGARTVLHGDSYDEAYEHALQLAAEKGLVFIHPFDDPMVIAGQGTVAPAHRPSACGLRALRRRWADRRHGRLHQGVASRDQGDRCGARRCAEYAAGAGGEAAGGAQAGRHLR
jgi:threonine dehydratase